MEDEDPEFPDEIEIVPNSVEPQSSITPMRSTLISRDGRQWNPNVIGPRRKLRHNVFKIKQTGPTSATKRLSVIETFKLILSPQIIALCPWGKHHCRRTIVSVPGRCSFVMYIPSKPAKYGIKIWWVNDFRSYYPYQGQIYTGLPESGFVTLARERGWSVTLF